MNTSFTPGPWTLGKGKVTIREVDKPGRKGFIARCHMPGEYRVRSEEEAEANARLIAASPRLYAALDWFVQFCDEHPEWTENELCNGRDDSAEAFWLQDARAAINLATGQEP